jgi:hypothetical protein
MVYDDDTTWRRFRRRILPNSDVPESRRRRRSSAPVPNLGDDVKRRILELAGTPGWDARRIRAQIRAETNRHDITVDMINRVLRADRTGRR